MARTLEQIIRDAKSKRYDERLANVQGVYRFDIEGAGSYRLQVDHGSCSVEEGAGEADCVISCEPGDFARMIDGQQNMLTAYMQGRVRIDGDIALAKSFHGFIGAKASGGAEGAHR